MKLTELFNNPNKPTENSFTFDLNRMRDAINSPSHTVPDNLDSLEDFDKWLEEITS